MPYEEVFKEIIDLMPRLPVAAEDQERLMTLSLLLSNKFIAEDEYKRIVEAIKLVLENYKVFKVIQEIAYDEGQAKGKAEGKAEGKAAQKKETAKSLLSLGASIEWIKASTGLSESDIAELQREIDKASNS